MFRVISIFLCFCFIFAGEFRPDVSWYQYETKNFRLIFNDNSKYLADFAYDIVEEIYDKISAQLGYHVREKVDILFNDTSDLILDYANYFSNTIMINTAKVPSTQIGPFAKNYLHNLITHELTHIVHLQMSPINDNIYAFAKRTTAKGWAYPYFVVEGMAILNEKYISGGGRLYNTSFYEQLMAFASEDDFPTVSQLFQREMVRWPMGHSPYLLGSTFISYLVDEYGMGKLIESYRYFASQINVTYEQAFSFIYGLKLEDEYLKFIKAYQNLYLVKQEGKQAIKEIITGNVEIKSFYVATKDQYYVYLNDLRSPAKVVEIKDGKSTILYENSLLYDGKILVQDDGLYFSRISLPNIYESRVTLVKLGENKEEVIDNGIVDIAGNAKEILYIKNNLGEDTIYRLSDKKEILYTSEALESIAISKSGKRYAYVEKKDNAKSLVLVDGESKKIIVTGDIKEVIFVNEDVWFVADRKGFSQLFRFDEKNKSFIQKTNVLTGVYNPQVLGEEIFFITFRNRGMALVSVTNDFSKIVLASRFEPDYKAVTEFKWVPSTTQDSVEVVSSDYYTRIYSSAMSLEKNKEPIKSANLYNPLSLKMMYLYPYFYTDNYGSEVGFSTYLSDPLEFNTLMLNFYGSSYGKFFNIQYLNSFLYPNFLLQSNKDGRNDFFSIGFQLPLQKDKIQQNIFLGMIDYYDKDVLIHNFYTLAYLLGTIEKYPYSISYERGFVNKLNFDFSRKNGRLSVLNDFNLYLPSVFQNHVIKFSLLAGHSKDFYYKLSGFPGTNYVRGLDVNDVLKGGVMGKATCEYRIPVEVVDDLSLLGMYHKHTGLIFFYDLADAKDNQDDFMKNPFWSYGFSLEILGEYSNLYPISVGLGYATTSQKEDLLFFSFGTLLN